uniref:Uncharacterized protein n=1 Tax=Ixodes ricinus TaxID=34613 RepID=A0A6B0U6P3_IXORI
MQLRSFTPMLWLTGLKRFFKGGDPGIGPTFILGGSRTRFFCSAKSTKSSLTCIFLGAIPNSPRSSSSIKSSGCNGTLSDLLDLEDLNVAGVHPSFVPTVL